jgi:hypothetical protein
MSRLQLCPMCAGQGAHSDVTYSAIGDGYPAVVAGRSAC